jgi:DME family drug/metabolite transporter
MRAIGLVCLAGALWGTVGVATGLMSEGAAVDPTLSALSRTAVGAAVLLALAPLLRLAPGRGDMPWRLLALFGVAGAVFQITLFASYVAVGVTVTVVMTACLPIVLVAIGDAVVARRIPEPWFAAAILTAAAGVVLVGAGSADATQAAPAGGRVRGIALVTVSACAFAVVAAAGRALGTRLDALRAAGFGLAATALTLTICAGLRCPGLEGRASPLDVSLTTPDLLLLAYVGVVATGGAYLAFVAGMALARSAGTGLAATLIEPGVAALLAALVLREPMAGAERVGCLLIVVGMLALAQGESRRAPAARGA